MLRGRKSVIFLLRSVYPIKKTNANLKVKLIAVFLHFFQNLLFSLRVWGWGLIVHIEMAYPK